MDPLQTLDDFLPQPHLHRDVTRILRRILFDTAWGMVAVVGRRSGAARLVEQLMRTHPDAHGHRYLVRMDPVRLVPVPDGEPRTLDMPAAQVLRALLRQDPDGMGVEVMERDAVQVLLSAAQTGHQVVVGVEGRTAEDVLAFMAGADAGLPVTMLSMFVPWVVELDARGDRDVVVKIRRMVEGRHVDVVTVDERGVHVDRARLPWAEAPAAPVEPALPRMAPPLAERAPPRHAPRIAWVPVTDAGALGPHRLHASHVLWPRGRAWPMCRGCASPLVHVVQLDLAEMPGDARAMNGTVQLFLCTHGCDTSDASSLGVLLERVDTTACEELAAPEHPHADVLAPGGITSWTRVEEEPAHEDLVLLGLASADDDGDASLGPVRCDKAGGWPAWEQGSAWPGSPDALELLFQWVEGAPRAGGAAPALDDATGTVSAPVPAARVLDPNLPRHFELLTGEAVAFVWMEKATGRLAFLWQTG